MKPILILGSSLALFTTCFAEHAVIDFDWANPVQRGQLRGGNAIEVDGKSVLSVVNTNRTALLTELLTITNPPITKKLYALTGEVKYEDVHGDAYLEMWNFFPPLREGMPEGQFFSRTLSLSGEMGKITGTSGWRTFSLPFDSTGATGLPTRLKINLFLPGRGIAFVGPIKLVEYAGSLTAAGTTSPDAWWSDRAAGLVGGIGGSVFGCIAGLLGWLAFKGMARQFVIIVSWLLIGFGSASTLAAIVALSMRQPYAVWFPLALGGMLLLGIIPFRLRNFLRHYEDLELRRMTAIDAMKG